VAPACRPKRFAAAKKKAPGGIAIQGLLSVGTEPEQITQVPKYSPGIHHWPVLGKFQLTVPW
jgi:hypothetical protein